MDRPEILPPGKSAYSHAREPPRGTGRRPCAATWEGIGQIAGLLLRRSLEMLRWTLAANKLNEGRVGETVRKMLGAGPARWSEVGRKVKRIIELDPSL